MVPGCWLASGPAAESSGISRPLEATLPAKDPGLWGRCVNPAISRARAVRGGYLDPDGGASALEEVLGLGHQDGLVAGPHGAALALGGEALGCGRLQGKAHGLGAVQTVCGVVEAAAVLGPWGHPLGAAVLVGVLRGLRAALRGHRDQGLGGGARGDGRRRLLVVRVGDGCRESQCAVSVRSLPPGPLLALTARDPRAFSEMVHADRLTTVGD